MKWVKGATVVANDKMQRYTYRLEASPGRDMAFAPAYTPREMLAMGVFEGRYCRDCHAEFPPSWFRTARFAADRADVTKNKFGVKSRLSLQEWRARGWIIAPDVRGWFQWYMRYYLGRRIPAVDAHQIARWHAMARHAAQVRKHCTHGRPCRNPMQCRPRQRQALLQWSWPCLE